MTTSPSPSLIYINITENQVPRFVCEKLTKLANDYAFDTCPVIFNQIQGTIDNPFIDIAKQVTIWISCDQESFYVHLGGSGCWITMGSDCTFFEKIDPTLLSRIPIWSRMTIIKVDLHTEQIFLYEVDLVSEEDMAGREFPDL